MSAKDDYKTYKREVGKDVLKTLAFFFIGVPAVLFIIVWLLLPDYA